jgi:putative nucleotidyltransferase with HDIG domain
VNSVPSVVNPPLRNSAFSAPQRYPFGPRIVQPVVLLALCLGVSVANPNLLRYSIPFSEKPRMPTRDDAWKLLCEYTQSESLRKHMLAVEACVRAYARKHGADEELWGLAALLHDFDYERWPNEAHAPDKEHPAEGARILREQGYSEEIVRAILSHADYCNVPRQSPLEHTLFACDELAGFLTACAYVRPSKSILDLEVDSVKRRLKDKAFAKGVSREDVRKGAEELGIPLEEHIAFCIAALRDQADALNLRGTIAATTAT